MPANTQTRKGPLDYSYPVIATHMCVTTRNSALEGGLIRASPCSRGCVGWGLGQGGNQRVRALNLLVLVGPLGIWARITKRIVILMDHSPVLRNLLTPMGVELGRKIAADMRTHVAVELHFSCSFLAALIRALWRLVFIAARFRRSMQNLRGTQTQKTPATVEQRGHLISIACVTEITSGIAWEAFRRLLQFLGLGFVACP